MKTKKILLTLNYEKTMSGGWSEAHPKHDPDKRYPSEKEIANEIETWLFDLGFDTQIEFIKESGDYETKGD